MHEIVKITPVTDMVMTMYENEMVKIVILACLQEKDLKVISQSGGKTGDIKNILSKSKENSCGDVYVHVATNDCATKFPLDKIAPAQKCSWSKVHLVKSAPGEKCT